MSTPFTHGWTTVTPRDRSPSCSSTPPATTGAPLRPGTERLLTMLPGAAPVSRIPRGRSSSGGNYDSDRGYDHSLPTIREGSTRPRSRSAAPPIHQSPPLGAYPPTPLTTLTRSLPFATPTGFGGTINTPSQRSVPTSTVTPSRTPPPTGGFFPSIPSYDNHAEQREPTPTALDIMHGALAKHLRHWSLSDFGPLTELTGRSVLVSLFVDYAHAVRPGGLSMMQRYSLAQRARTTHPGKLLQLIKDRRRALEYTEVTLTTAHPPQIESQLCPSDTPDLVANDGLRKHIRNPNLTRGDLLQMILPFLQCYYSADTGIEPIVRKMSRLEISDLVYTPGAVMRLMNSPNRINHFETPHWYSLRRTTYTTGQPVDQPHPDPYSPTLILLGLPHTFPSLPFRH